MFNSRIHDMDDLRGLQDILAKREHKQGDDEEMHRQNNKFHKNLKKFVKGGHSDKGGGK